MVKADFILRLIEAYGNDKLFTDISWQIVEDEKTKGNQIFSNKLKNIVKSKLNKQYVSTSSLTNNFTKLENLNNEKNLFEIRKSTQTLSDIALSEELTNSLMMVLKEVKNRDKLDNWGIKDVGRILLYGPPGTGKTLWAHVLAGELDYELLYVRLDTLISSYLGETGKNIRKIFDIANSKNLILFIDEFDAIAKMRDDSRELGELKRVVNVLIQNIDDFHSNSILVAATNHPQLLDNAIWRRFDEILKFDLPNKNERKQIFQIHTRKIPLENIDIDEITKKTEYFSGDDIQKMIRHAVRFVIQYNRDDICSEDFNGAIKIIRSRKSNEKNITVYDKPTTKIELAKSYRENGLTYEKIANILKISVSSAHRLVNK